MRKKGGGKRGKREGEPLNVGRESLNVGRESLNVGRENPSMWGGVMGGGRAPQCGLPYIQDTP